MKLTFHGAARTVTGSRHLLEVNGHRLLLDCGLYHGTPEEKWERNRHFPFEPASIDAVVLSHAHIDHSGNIPRLIERGFRGPVHSTRATKGLCEYMLEDSGKIHEYDAEDENERRRERGQPPIDPLYTRQDAREAMGRFEDHRFDTAFEVVPGVMATFRDAGHLLGAAVVVLDIEANGVHRRLCFSGDLGRHNMPLLRDPMVPEDVGLLILESTYGNRTHESPDEGYATLRDLVRRAHERRGKLLIPSFAIGRAQDLIYQLHQMMDDGEVPRCPIYVDSPLAVKATRVFRRCVELYDEETEQFLEDDPHTHVFDFPEVNYIQDVEASKRLNDAEGPMVVISTSGMVTAGRIIHHLAHAVWDPNNTVLIVGWQAPGTTGRELVEGADSIELFGKDFSVNAHVEVINGFSGHADRDGLLTFADGIAATSDLERVFLVHGEEDAAFALRDALRERGAAGRVDVPEMGEGFGL